MSSIPVSRTLQDFHKEVKEINARKEEQSSEISRCKKVLLESIKKLQSLSYQSIARSGYFMRMTPSNSEQLMRLPFMSNEGISVYDRIVEVGGINEYRSSMTKFMKNLYKCIGDLPQLLATLTSSKPFGQQPFLPDGIKLSDFIACSTFPALFGQIYSVELRKAYINFLVNIAKSLPKEVYDNFRDHWLFDCIKSYIHASNVQTFLRRSIGTIILEIVRDKELVQLAQTKNQQQLFDRISEIIKRMIDNMNDNFVIFPEDVRYLLHSFSETAETEEEQIKRIELIFIDTILAPAVSLPKSYGVLPSTMYFDMSPLGPARVLQVIAQSFRFILHPNQAQDRYQGVDLSKLTALPFKQFLQSAALSTLDVAGLQLQDVIDVLKIYQINLMFSVPDVIALAHITKLLPLTNKVSHQDLGKSANEIPTDQPVPFEFYRVEHFQLQDFGLVGTRLKDPQQGVKIKSSQGLAANALYRLLSYMEVKPQSPPDMEGFINYHQTQGQLEADYQHLTHIQHFVEVKRKMKEDLDIIPSLEEILRRWRTYIQANEGILELAASQISKVRAEMSKYEKSRDEWISIYHYTLLERFVSENKEILDVFNEKKNDMLLIRSVFDDLYISSIKQIKIFISRIEPEQYSAVACNFHSMLMAQLPYAAFKEQHINFTITDKKLIEMKQEVIERICHQKTPPKVRRIFEFPPLFKFAITELENAEKVELPIEALSCICRALTLLRRVFELEIGGIPQADDINPLLIFALLSSSMKGIYSFGKYLEFYLGHVYDRDLVFLSPEMESALGQYVGRINELDNVISQM